MSSIDGHPNKRPIIILAPSETEPLKSVDCSNTADLERISTTINLSKVHLDTAPLTKSLNIGNLPIPYSINQKQDVDHKAATCENVGTEVVWLPSASQKSKTSLVFENENIETLHSEIESDEDNTSVSDQSNSENESLNSSRDTQHRYDSNNTTLKKNEQDLNPRSEKFNLGDRKKTFNPKDVLKQLKAINSTEILKSGSETSVSKKEYCREWLKHQELSGFEQDKKLFNFLASKLKPSRALESREYLKSLVSSLSYELSHMWTESGKNKDKLYKEYSDWLNGPNIKLTASKPVDIQPISNVPDKFVRINIETNADAFKFLKNLEQPFKADGLIKLVPCMDLTPEQKAKLIDFCKRYVADMKFKWLTCNHNEGLFFKKFECWLKLNIKWPVFLKDILLIPKTTDTKTVANKEFNILSNFSEELVMKIILNSKIDTIEKVLASKCSETGNDISKLIHRVIHHPEDAALIAGVISDERECNCYPKNSDKKIPDKHKKFKPPSQAQKEVLKMAVERLKDSMPTPKDPLKEDTTESPIHKKYSAPAETHKATMNQMLYRLKVANLPLQRKEVNQAEIISKVNDPIVIDDEDDEIETYQANEIDNKIVKGGVFKCKVVSPAKTNKHLYHPKVCMDTVITTAEESLHNSNEKMIVNTPIDDDNTIDSDDNFGTPTEQTNENIHKNLEFGPVLDKLIFTQPSNLTHGAIVRLPNNKEGIISKVSNCSAATVLIPKFIKKSGPNVHVRKSNYKLERLVDNANFVKNNTASSIIRTEKQTSSNKNYGILNDSPTRSQESLVQMQTVSRKVSVLGNAKRKEEIILSVRSSPSSKFKTPSQAQKEVLKNTMERLKGSMPKHAAPKDPLYEDDTTESPFHKKHDASSESHQAMLNKFLYRLKANLPVPDSIPIRKELNQAELISKVNDPIVIHNEDDEIETYQPNERGDKIVKGGVFKCKVVSPAKTNKQLNQSKVCLGTAISTAEESLHNSSEMIVDIPMNKVDSKDNFVTPPEQTNENNQEKLEFGPVLDKLIFIKALNLPNGTIIRLANNKEAIICKVSNCSATVLVPKFYKKSGPNVHVRKSKCIMKRLVKRPTILRKKTASSKTSTEKQTPSNKKHGILQDFQEIQEQESLVQMENASRKVSALCNTKRKEEIIASVKFKPPSQAQKALLKMTVARLKNSMP